LKRSSVEGPITTGGIQAGIVLVEEGTPLPESMRLEGPSDSDGWQSVEVVDRSEFERKINRAGWIFFLMAGEIKATVFGFNQRRALRAAMDRIIASVKFQKCNSLQITEVTAKSFLKLPYVSVSARSRHIQEQPREQPRGRFLERPQFNGQQFAGQ
jgi:hypothetical protein